MAESNVGSGEYYSPTMGGTKICPTPDAQSSDGTKWGPKRLPDEPERSAGMMKLVQMDNLGGDGNR